MSEAGGRDLAFVVYPYPNHARLVVTLRHHKPVSGRALVLGSLRLDIGREDLAGLASHDAVRLVAVSILNALAADASRETRAKPPPPPGGVTGAVALPGLDRLE